MQAAQMHKSRQAEKYAKNFRIIFLLPFFPAVLLKPANQESRFLDSGSARQAIYLPFKKSGKAALPKAIS